MHRRISYTSMVNELVYTFLFGNNAHAPTLVWSKIIESDAIPQHQRDICKNASLSPHPSHSPTLVVQNSSWTLPKAYYQRVYLGYSDCECCVINYVAEIYSPHFFQVLDSVFDCRQTGTASHSLYGYIHVFVHFKL